ncbi:hypothetical protein GCM10027036_18780 [Flavihumibacter cheonanensis]|uniref:hypothetical protein n=1 Tax=Flavihumibacter cheonanensis TaxID=1442385 RepID=UPI001EF7ADED|nr:hypothetical protein [Flavihumibacter cheonanensis]MCG7754013.1 hypothetical protein [Flavihumibacter cheonanensis]
MIQQIQIVGIALILLALLHLIFPRYFNWKKELAGLSVINREMMIVHTFFIALTVLLMGILCITSANELSETTLGKRLAAGIGLFWFIRWIVQFTGYSSVNWKGKNFETAVHVFFSLFWTYVTGLFWWVAFS